MSVEAIAMELFFPDARLSFDDFEKFKLTFRYNTLHDIESAWWLGV
jgi:hypothetical protein